jgi:hypothetical protein
VILGVIEWTGLARSVRGKLLSVREEPYVEAAVSIGAPPGMLLFRHAERSKENTGTALLQLLERGNYSSPTHDLPLLFVLNNEGGGREDAVKGGFGQAFGHGLGSGERNRILLGRECGRARWTVQARYPLNDRAVAWLDQSRVVGLAGLEKKELLEKCRLSPCEFLIRVGYHLLELTVKKNLEDSGQVLDYQDGPAFTKFLGEEYRMLEDVAKKAKLIK